MLNINSELQAASLLKEVVLGAEVADPRDLKIGEWANLHINIPGEPYVLSTSVMRGIIAFQDSVYRGSAVIIDGQPNIAYLNAREKELLTLKAKLTEGSTDVKLDVNQIIGDLVGPLVGKLSARQIMTLVLSGALVWGGNSFYRNYTANALEHKELDLRDAQNQRLMDHLATHSAHDGQVIDALMIAQQESVRASQLNSIQNVAAPEIIKGLKNERASTLEGIPLTSYSVDTIVRKQRQPTEERIINATFRIENVNTKSTTGFRIRLINTDSNETFTAGLEDAMISNETRAVIESATYNKTAIDATVTAKIKNGKIIDATINSADHVPQR